MDSLEYVGASNTRGENNVVSVTERSKIPGESYTFKKKKKSTGNTSAVL